MRKFMRRAATAVAAATMAAAISGHTQAQNLIAERQSVYNTIYIYQDGTYVSMLFGRNRRLFQESRANQADPLELPSVYTRFMSVGLAYSAEQNSVLEIGVGGGTVIAYLNRTFPEMQIDAVELDPAVIDFAREYFFLTENDNLRVHVRDGRIHLLRDRNRYDIIMVDAYRGTFVPFHLLTQEFFQLIEDRLNPGGVVVQNVDPSTILYDSTVATIGAVFDHVDVYRAGGNFVLIGYNGDALSTDELIARGAAIDAEFSPRYSLGEMAAQREIAEAGPSGQVLTDDFAPVDSLNAVERNNSPEDE